MKKIILFLFMAVSMATATMAERTPCHLSTHTTGSHAEDLEIERSPINLPIKVIYDSSGFAVMKYSVIYWSSKSTIQN